LERFEGRERGIAPIIDPLPVHLIAAIETDDVQVDYEIGKASSGLGVSLHDELEPLDDTDAGEVEVALVDPPPVDDLWARGKHQQRGSEGTLACVIGGMKAPRLHESAIAGRAAYGPDGGRFVITEVPDVPVVEVEFVVPGRVFGPRLPRT
jgi:hypothetical protein